MKVFIFLFVLLLPISVFSQRTAFDEAVGGTTYSRIGIGFPLDIASPNADGMGLSGVSVFDPFMASLSNPAHWGKSNFTQGSVALGLQSFYAEDNFDSERSTAFDFENFQFVFPIVKQKLGASISFTPLTRSRFNLDGVSELQIEPGRDPITFNTNNRGTGGVNRAEAGLGYTINDNLSVGYAASVYFTNMENDVRTTFSSARFSPVEFTEAITGTGFGNRFGIFSRFQQLFSDRDWISLGATINLPVSYSANRQVESFVCIDGIINVDGRCINGTDTLVDILDENQIRRADIKFPLEINAGLTYNSSARFNVSSEVIYQNWKEAEFGFRPGEEQYFVDRLKLGIGAQFHPYISNQNRGFFSNFRYSAGVSYDSGHLRIDGNDIDTIMFNAGLGIITRGDASTVDINFNFGFRGTESDNLIREQIWGIKLSLNLAEIMFLQPRFQ